MIMALSFWEYYVFIYLCMRTNKNYLIINNSYAEKVDKRNRF